MKQSMSRDYKVYLEDILEAVNKIIQYTTGMSLEEFSRDAKTIEAVVRNLEIIGEAAKHVPKHIRVKNPDIEWKQIAGLRDILIHEYFSIDLDIIWDIIRNKLPVLESKINQIIKDRRG